VELKADHLIGRLVVAMNGRRIGRLEELRAKRAGSLWIVTGYVVGAGGLVERLALGARHIVGLTPGAYLVHWDQLALSERGPLRLTCPVGALEVRPAAGRAGGDKYAR
jgi:hypothetical protein